MLETGKNYGVQQTLIDGVGFYFGNSIVSSASSISKPKIDETVIFMISDLLIRNGYITWYKDMTGFQDNLGKNAYIGVASFLLTTLYDMIKSKGVGDSIKDNLVKNAVGVATNSLVDMAISKSYR